MITDQEHHLIIILFYFDYLLIQVLETCSIFRWSRPADSLCKRRTPDDEDDEDDDDNNGEDTP